jgi:hypothetical protein
VLIGRILSPAGLHTLKIASQMHLVTSTLSRRFQQPGAYVARLQQFFRE